MPKRGSKDETPCTFELHFASSGAPGVRENMDVLAKLLARLLLSGPSPPKASLPRSARSVRPDGRRR